jgi:hypothetical protein
MFIFSAKVNGRGDLFMLQAQEHFDEAQYSRGCSCMTDVGFQRANRTKALFGSEFIEGICERMDLYRISQFGPRTMCLDVLKVFDITVVRKKIDPSS